VYNLAVPALDGPNLKFEHFRCKKQNGQQSELLLTGHSNGAATL